ncbi:hypothetical protein COTS27_01116 [Spirochaetota bacterium]|nr:hypothetical protein COTS27_01116 [Spirochaetota bacterium]
MQSLYSFITRFFIIPIKNSSLYNTFTLSDINKIDLQRKQILTYIFFFTGTIIGIIFAFFNYQNHNYIVIIVDCILVISILILFPIIKYEKIFNVTIKILILVYFFIIGSLLIISHYNNSYVLWLLTVPSVFIFLLGSSWGTGVSLLLLGLLITLESGFGDIYLFEKNFFYRVVFVYVMLIISNLIYEHTRNVVQTTLSKKQSLLDQTIDKLDQQQVEYIKIMHNLNEGIFLLDQHLRIKNPYSTALKHIIDVKFITIGAPLVKILEEHVFKSKLIELEHYLTKIIRNRRIPLDLVNPLEKLTIRSKKHQEQHVKTLSFSFTIITLNHDKIEILGRVSDISKEILLQKKLREQKTKKIQEMERLMSITKLNPTYLNQFIKSTTHKLTDLKNTLQKTPYLREINHYSRSNTDNQNKNPNHLPAKNHAKESTLKTTLTSEAPHNEPKEVEKPLLSKSQLLTLFLSTFHAIKGNASAIGFVYFAELVHSLEAEINKIKTSPPPTLPSNQNTPTHNEGHYETQLQTLLLRLNQEIATTEEIVYQLGEFNYRYTDLSVKFKVNLPNFLNHTIAHAQTKPKSPIQLDTKYFNEALLPNDDVFYEKIKSVLVLLVKNSIAHSIESTSDRIKLGKPPHATLTLSTSRLEAPAPLSQSVVRNQESQHLKTNPTLSLTYSDDGKGIDINMIKHHLKTRYNYDTPKINSYSKEELINMIFCKEFSTAPSLSFEAGRGMGMYFIKETVKDLGGTTRVSSTYRSGFKITLTFPIS